MQKEDVKTLPKSIFERVDRLAAPRLVEYWEQDPCEGPRYRFPGAARPMASFASRGIRAAEKKKEVRILAQFAVGEYEIVILGADDSMALDTWLRREGYAIPAGAEPVLRPYVQAGMKFFVAKVDVKKVRFEGGEAMLSPLRFHYASEQFSLPVRLGLINSSGTQDLIVHVLARGQRYEVANYDNVAIPTNLDVNPGAKQAFAAFYAALFDKTMEKNPGAVVTEYAWEARSCDPCPDTPLTPSELATLGTDVLGPAAASGQGFVLTRLHTRYRKDALGQDLVFAAAPPIAGGRESWGSNGRLETGAQSSGINNFQGRYALRHPWGGPIACKNPNRGRWGGPPIGIAQPRPKAALKLASAPRGSVKLDWMISPMSLATGKAGGSKLSSAKSVPAMQIAPAPAPTTATTTTTTTATATVAATDTAPVSAPAPAPAAPAPLPATPPQVSGCAGCRAGAAGSAGGGGIALALGAALALWRRARAVNARRGR